MSRTQIVVERPRRIAGKFLGGFVPAVPYHFGVLEELQGRGFVLRSGFRDPDEPRETGPPGLDLVAGSSAGAFFVVAACAGVEREELLGLRRRSPVVPPFEARLLGEGHGLVHKVVDWIREGPVPSWSGRRTWKAWAAESTLNALFPLWDLSSMRSYLHDGILGGRSFEDLRTEAAILAVDLNHPVTYVIGEREAPVLELFRQQPVSAEAIHRILGSEGFKILDEFAAIGIPPDHPALEPFRREPWRRHVTVPIRGVPMASAAIGSMATYPFYAPVHLHGHDGEPYRLGHYPVVVEDGEDRNPFATDVAEDLGADLVFVSSISAPYKFSHALGSLERHGYGELHYQKSAHSRDAKQESVARDHHRFRELLAASREIVRRTGADPASLDELEATFHRVARTGNIRIRLSPDPDVGAENRLLRTLDPLEFSARAVERAYALGRMVARRVLKRYEFAFLE